MSTDQTALFHSTHDYVLKHAATILHQVRDFNALYRLIIDNRGWMDAKFLRFNGDEEYVNDVELALTDLSDPLREDQLIQYLQLQVARCAAYQRGDLYDDTDLKTLTLIGNETLALNYAQMRIKDDEKFDGIIVVHNTTQELGKSDIGILQLAYELAKKYPPRRLETNKSIALGKVAIAFAKIGAYSSALEATSGITLHGNWHSVVADIAIELAQKNLWEDSYQVLDHLEDFAKPSVFYALAVSYAKAELFDEAFSVLINLSGHKHTEIAARRAIAIQLFRSGRMSEADFHLGMVAKEINELKGTTSIHHQVELASAWQEFSEVDKARATLHDAFQEYDKLYPQGKLPYRFLYFEFIKATVSLEMHVLLDKVILSSLEVAEHFEQDKNKYEFLIAMIETLSSIGQFEHAIEITNTKFDQLDKKSTSLSIIASSMVLHGDVLRGKRLFDEAELLLPLLSELELHLQGIRQIALNFAKAGLHEDAKRTLDFVPTLALRVRISKESSLSRMSLVQGFISVLKLETALQIIDGISDGGTKAFALTHLVYHLIDNERLDEAFQVALTINRQYASILEALADVATAFARAGRAEEAIKIRNAIHDGTYNWLGDKTPNIVQGFLSGGYYDSALQVAHSAPTPEGKIASLRLIAKFLFVTGRKVEGMRIREHAYRELAHIKHSHQRCVEMAKLGYLEEAIELAKKMSPSGNRADLINELAIVLANNGNLAEANDLTIDAGIRPENISVSCAVAIEYFKRGELATAQAVLEDIWSKINVGSEIEFHHINTYGEFINTLTKCGFHEMAESVFKTIPEDMGIDKYATFRPLIIKLMESGKIVHALSLVSSRDLDILLYAIGYGAPKLLELFPSLGINLLKKIVFIAAWVRPDWNEVTELLSNESYI